MDLLLDSHVFLWWQGKSSRLRQSDKDRIANPHNRVYVSAVTIWEIGLKRGLRKLKFSGSVLAAVSANRFVALAITGADAERFETLPWHHRDPFDRMMIAQALERDLTIMTSDAEFKHYTVPLIEIGA